MQVGHIPAAKGMQGVFPVRTKGMQGTFDKGLQPAGHISGDKAMQGTFPVRKGCRAYFQQQRDAGHMFPLWGA